MTVSAIYAGQVSHRRLRPKAHFLRYRIFQLYLDLDEASALSAQRRWFGFNRAALLSFYEADHGDGTQGSLKEQVRRRARAAGFDADGAVRVLCLPRVLGYVFNPITLFFCHAGDGALSCIVHQVNSTFGERCFYILPAHPDASGGPLRQTARKRMHVSPFMEMDHRYDFRVTEVGETFTLGIDVARDEDVWLTAGFTAERRPFTDAALLKTWLAHPLVTLKVIAGIHWEALKIWLKGVPLRGAPPIPHHEVLTLKR